MSEATGDETMARKYDDDIMAEFSKIERMISEQAYDTIHRFENLHKQNNNIINRISKVEDLLSGGVAEIMGGETLNNKRVAAKQGSNDAFRLSDEEFWEAHGGMGRLSPGTVAGMGPEISPNSTQIDLLTANEETQQYLNNMEAQSAMRGSRTHSSPNIRQSVTTETVNTVPTNRRPRVFPSTPNVGSSSEQLPNNINSITNIFPKNISNLSKRDNTDVTTPSLISEHTKIYQKGNVWMKRRSSPISVLEIGRTASGMEHRNKLVDTNFSDPSRPSVPNSAEEREPDSTVFLNVGGKRFEVLWHTLGQFQSSRLGRLHDCISNTAMLEICDRYILADSEFFFDRSPRHFESILNLYRTGQLHLMEGVCVQAFAEELAYWGLDDLHLEPCCQYAFYRMKQFLPGDKEEDKEEVDDFGPSSFNRMRKFIWELFEEPNKTKLGKVQPSYFKTIR